MDDHTYFRIKFLERLVQEGYKKDENYESCKGV